MNPYAILSVNDSIGYAYESRWDATVSFSFSENIYSPSSIAIVKVDACCWYRIARHPHNYCAIRTAKLMETNFDNENETEIVPMRKRKPKTSAPICATAQSVTFCHQWPYIDPLAFNAAIFGQWNWSRSRRTLFSAFIKRQYLCDSTTIILAIKRTRHEIHSSFAVNRLHDVLRVQRLFLRRGRTSANQCMRRHQRQRRCSFCLIFSFFISFVSRSAQSVSYTTRSSSANDRIVLVLVFGGNWEETHVCTNRSELQR